MTVKYGYYYNGGGEHQGKRLCHEYCAHVDSYGDPIAALTWCKNCVHVRKMDEIADEIIRLIRNNLNRPLDLDVLYEHLTGVQGWSQKDVWSAANQAVDYGRLVHTRTWALAINPSDV